jgi:hypothetical protein
LIIVPTVLHRTSTEKSTGKGDYVGTARTELRRVRKLTLEWDEFAAWWQADVGDRATRSVFDDGTTYRIFRSPHAFVLWVWSGPAEDSPVLGMSGSDLRNQKRAKRLASYDTVEEAMQGAEAFDTTGQFAFTSTPRSPRPPHGPPTLF